MADQTVTAANVKWLGGTPLLRFKAGETLTHGMAVVLGTSADTVLAADADAQARAGVIGIVVAHMPNLAADASVVSGEMVDVAVSGSVITGFSGMTTGAVLYASTNSGKICPYSDFTSGDYACQVGVAKNATDLLILCGARPVAAIA